MPAAYAFDLYGTLVDFTSLRDRVAAVAADPAAFVDLWRAKQLQYSFLATLMERYLDFDEITARALDVTCATLAVALPAAARAELSDAWTHLPAHPDAPAALAALRARGTRMVVLSNGTPRALERTVREAGIAGAFDALLSVAAVRAYKPRPAVYRLATEFFALAPERIGFVSSNGWDAAGAAAFGMRVFWCNRTGAPPEAIGPPPARTIRSLGELLEG